MKEILKQRLVGAVVLIALAVIFVPMIFEVPDEGQRLLGNALPTQPDHEMPERIRPIELPAVPDPVPEIIQIEEPAPPEAAAAIEDAPPPSPVVQDVEPEVVTSSQPEQAEKEAKEPGKSEQSQRALAGWVVQVASVQSKDNALALKDKLRGLGFDSFVEQVKTSKGLLYRVRVGPEVKRSGAEKQRDQLSAKASLKGIILQYP